jgi:hypothetical protein
MGAKKKGDKTLTVLMVQKAAELPIFLKHVVGAANMGIKYGDGHQIWRDWFCVWI